MPNTTELEKLVQQLDLLLEEMIDQQRQKVVQTAQRIQPGLSEDDLRDPHSFPQVNSRPEFCFEDGILSGIIAARIAVIRDAVEYVRARNTDSVET